MKPSPTAICVEHIPHRLAYGAIELLSVLAQREDVRLRFFSAGDAKRNVPLVMEIGKEIGKSIGTMTCEPYKSYSGHCVALYNHASANPATVSLPCCSLTILYWLCPHPARVTRRRTPSESQQMLHVTMHDEDHKGPPSTHVAPRPSSTPVPVAPNTVVCWASWATHACL
jgi:hypothetical protein